jgi:hypothetical protein
LTQVTIVLFLFSGVKQREMAKAPQVEAEMHQSGVFSQALGKPAQMPYVCLRTVTPRMSGVPGNVQSADAAR